MANDIFLSGLLDCADQAKFVDVQISSWIFEKPYMRCTLMRETSQKRRKHYLRCFLPIFVSLDV